MFTVEDADSESMVDCGIFPALDDTLDTMNAEEVANMAAVVAAAECSRDQICSYELVDYEDVEVINVLHVVSELPVPIQILNVM